MCEGEVPVRVANAGSRHRRRIKAKELRKAPPALTHARGTDFPPPRATLSTVINPLSPPVGEKSLPDRSVGGEGGGCDRVRADVSGSGIAASAGDVRDAPAPRGPPRARRARAPSR